MNVPVARFPIAEMIFELEQSSSFRTSPTAMNTALFGKTPAFCSGQRLSGQPFDIGRFWRRCCVWMLAVKQPGNLFIR